MIDEARLTAQLGEAIHEALDLRMLPPLPVDGAPADVLTYLQDARRRLDRVEFLLARTLRLRGFAQRAATQANAEADAQWDDAIRKVRTAPVQAGGEYSSAKERHAEANIATFNAHRAARQATETAHRCDEAVDILRLTHRGLDGARQDALVVIRALAFESHLER